MDYELQRVYVVIGGDYGEEIYGIYSTEEKAIDVIRKIIKKEIEHIENTVKKYKDKNNFYYHVYIEKLNRALKSDPAGSYIAWYYEWYIDKEPEYEFL